VSPREAEYAGSRSWLPSPPGQVPLIAFTLKEYALTAGTGSSATPPGRRCREDRRTCPGDLTSCQPLTARARVTADASARRAGDPATQCEDMMISRTAADTPNRTAADTPIAEYSPSLRRLVPSSHRVQISRFGAVLSTTAQSRVAPRGWFRRWLTPDHERFGSHRGAQRVTVMGHSAVPRGDPHAYAARRRCR
jgi:hypothetical protein